ncbi:MAG: c-type cytochrome [Betaproteobacteria bacterium]|nr:c-type cytochrome [Betaproteobacteria bacterium]
MTTLRYLCNGAFGLCFLATVAPAMAAGDARKGASAFAEECGDCHSTKEGKAKKGPPLVGINGRKAGAISDFAYSEAMLQSAINWTPDKIDAYIAQPRKIVPGGKMKYDGLADAAARADVIAYVLSLK